MNVSEISRHFCNYYQSSGHVFLPSPPLLHPSVPMSFVMSAGLVQIETVLNNDIELKGDRFTLIQKCFRYFDVEHVGKDAFHLSLFEMPGAFSFAANGQRTAIGHMWQVVTEKLGIERNKLWITFFAGGNVSNHYFDADMESLQTWQQLGISDDRLVGLGPEDNYWRQGGGINGHERYRKCGPNTEIFYDRGEQSRCSDHCKPSCGCGRFVEFANSIFVENEIDEHTNVIRPLPRPFAKTVIGSERVAMIMQSKNDVFEIDSIYPILDVIRSKCTESDQNSNTSRISANVIADHLHALVHLVSDGAPPPGKDGRQRLMKILIRETLSHALLLNFEILNYLDELIERVLDLSEVSSDTHQVLEKTKKYVLSEAKRFSLVRHQGRQILMEYVSQNQGKTLSGNQVVLLEKQFGFPSELSQLYLDELGLPFPKEDYLTALQIWKASLSPQI